MGDWREKMRRKFEAEHGRKKRETKRLDDGDDDDDDDRDDVLEMGIQGRERRVLEERGKLDHETRMMMA